MKKSSDPSSVEREERGRVARRDGGNAQRLLECPSTPPNQKNIARPPKNQSTVDFFLIQRPDGPDPVNEHPLANEVDPSTQANW